MKTKMALGAAAVMILAGTATVLRAQEAARTTNSGVYTDAQAERGRVAVQDNCASCHGDDGTGMAEVGSADLADKYWLYGGDRQTILTTVYYGRQGQMQTWEGRLSPLDIKLLTLYILDLRAGDAS